MSVYFRVCLLITWLYRIRYFIVSKRVHGALGLRHCSAGIGYGSCRFSGDMRRVRVRLSGTAKNSICVTLLEIALEIVLPTVVAVFSLLLFL